MFYILLYYIFYTAQKVSVFRVFLIRIFHIWAEYGPKRHRIRTLFVLCAIHNCIIGVQYVDK